METILPRNIEDEMQAAYLDYSMSVIVGRALPDARDGLKPVHRRVLFSMHELGLQHNKPHRKSARVVGDVLGKYHPHGDSAVYETMVRMAQDFSLRYPLVDGQGNWGCFTKDTKVQLADGRSLSFEELVEEHARGKKNYTYTVDENSIIKVAQILNPRLTKKDASLVRITLDSGETIRCTPNHRFLLRTGAYKEASDLQSGESLMALYTKLSEQADGFKEPLTGYTLIFQPTQEQWVFAHWLADAYNIENTVYAVQKGKIRHHKDFNKQNNSPENIERMQWGEHWRLHAGLTKKRHTNDKLYVQKLREGREAFWLKPENRQANSDRLAERNRKNWSDESYRGKMRQLLSEVNKERIRKNPELRDVFSHRASQTLKRLWQNENYRQLFREKIAAANKRRVTNNTGKKKFLTICKRALLETGTLNEPIYNSYRCAVYPYGRSPLWENAFFKYYEETGSERLLADLCVNHKVAAVDTIPEREDVYDLTIENTHNFALAAGVFVHNSVDGDSAAAMRYCVTADTLLLTDEGLLPIGTLTEKEEKKIDIGVLSIDGKKKRAIKVFNSGIHPTIKITTKHGFSLEGSHNHPILTWKTGLDLRPMLSWKTLEDLEEGDIAVINREHSLFASKPFNLEPYQPYTGYRNSISLPDEMTSELAFLLGALVSEGSYHQKQALFINSDKRFYDQVKRAVIVLFPEVQLYERQLPDGCYEFSIYEQRIVLFLEAIGLKNVRSAEKEIPFTVLQSTEDHIRAFLKALFEGDGSIQSTIDKRHGGRSVELTYMSKSRKLISQLKTLLLNFGIVSNAINLDKRNDCGKLIISSQENVGRFNAAIGFFSNRKAQLLSFVNTVPKNRMSKNDFIPFLNDYLRTKYADSRIERLNYDRYNKLAANELSVQQVLDVGDRRLLRWLLKNHYLFSPITKIKHQTEEKKVYSIKVDSACHSFVANGFINHNTEARMTKIADALLEDIDKETVAWTDNFDASQKEPLVLPSKFPNLLINGSSGIAVGMATNIPPHNIREVCSAITATIDNPQLTFNELLKHITAPDFPTAGSIIGRHGIIEAYKTGKGKIALRGTIELEQKKDRNRLIITAIPYQVNKSVLIEQIAQAVRDKLLEGISDIRDESNKEGMRVVIELKKDAAPEVVERNLYSQTKLQQTFGIILLALVDNRPKVLNLRQLIDVFIKHRQDIVRKRTQHELKKAEERSHVLEGLIICLNNLDPIIALIKKSKEAKDAKTNLIAKYALSDIQAQAVLDMKLQRLTSLEQTSIRDEHAVLQKAIADYKTILADENKILAIIKKETAELGKQYGDDRRTMVEDAVDADFVYEDLIEDAKTVITISHEGYIKRIPTDTYKEQRRGGIGVIGATTKEEDWVEHLLTASTHDTLLVFTNRGKVHWVKVYELPEQGRTAKGRHIANIINLSQGEAVSAFVPVRTYAEGYLLFATQQGTVKKTKLDEFSRPRNGGIQAISLDEGDRLVNVIRTNGEDEIVLVSRQGMAVRCSEQDIRSMGRTAGGVRGITLDNGDVLVALLLAKPETTVLTITEQGYGKRTSIDEYRKIGRGGKGVITMNVEKAGPIVSSRIVDENHGLILITQQGTILRTPIADISIMGRATQGVRVMKLRPGDKLVAAASIESS